jgi:hypothetical protein
MLPENSNVIVKDCCLTDTMQFFTVRKRLGMVNIKIKKVYIYIKYSKCFVGNEIF